jgi:hypothetical protein
MKAMAEHKTVSVARFGSFSAKKSVLREYRNPRTGEPVDVPVKWRPKFTPSGTVLKKWVETGVQPARKPTKAEKKESTKAKTEKKESTPAPTATT